MCGGYKRTIEGVTINRTMLRQLTHVNSKGGIMSLETFKNEGSKYHHITGTLISDYGRTWETHYFNGRNKDGTRRFKHVKKLIGPRPLTPHETKRWDNGFNRCLRDGLLEVSNVEVIGQAISLTFAGQKFLTPRSWNPER